MATRAEEFEDKLSELLAEFSDVDRDDLLSALELQVMALKEEQ